MGMHQSELEISHGVGKIARKGDTSFISCASVYDKFYIFNIADEYAVDSFSKEINVKVVPKSLDGSESSLLVSTHSTSFRSIALPKGTKTKEIWAEEHPEETIGEFAYLSISDSEGKIVKYPAGDYVVVGADRLLL